MWNWFAYCIQLTGDRNVEVEQHKEPELQDTMLTCITRLIIIIFWVRLIISITMYWLPFICQMQLKENTKEQENCKIDKKTNRLHLQVWNGSPPYKWAGSCPWIRVTAVTLELFKWLIKRRRKTLCWTDVWFLTGFSFSFAQNVLRGCSVLLGPGTAGLWRTLTQSQNHIPGGGPAELAELLEQYTQNLAQNMKLTYLNPVALVAPNIGEMGIINISQTETKGILFFTNDLLRLS